VTLGVKYVLGLGVWGAGRLGGVLGLEYFLGGVGLFGIGPPGFWGLLWGRLMVEASRAATVEAL
jgi:hypothetical protein